MRASGSATRGATRWDSLRLYSPAFRDGLPGMPFPAPRTDVPDEGRDGRLPRGVRGALRASGPQRRGRRGADEGERPIRRAGRQRALRGRQRRRRHRRLQEAVHARVRGRARSEHHPASLQRLPQPVAAAGRAGARRRRRATRARTSPTRHRRHTTSSSRARTPGRFRCRSRAGADGSASACSCSSARTSSTSTRRWAARCARTSGTAVGRSSATAGRTCSPRESSASSREPSASSAAFPCSTTVASSTCATSSGAPASGPTSAGFAFPFEIGDDGYPVQYRGAAASSPGLYFAGLPFLHSFASMLIGGTARDAERVARHIVEERPPQLEACRTRSRCKPHRDGERARLERPRRRCRPHEARKTRIEAGHRQCASARWSARGAGQWQQVPDSRTVARITGNNYEFGPDLILDGLEPTAYGSAGERRRSNRSRRRRPGSPITETTVCARCGQPVEGNASRRCRWRMRNRSPAGASR